MNKYQRKIIENIHILIKSYHNPSLLDIFKENNPDKISITHIFNDGAIRRLTGRLVDGICVGENIAYSINEDKDARFRVELDIINYPMKTKSSKYTGEPYGYAIVLERHAYEIRNEMMRLI